jgi:hypothetical protein
MTQPLSSHGTLLQMGDGAGTLGTPAFTGTGLDDLSLDAGASYLNFASLTYRVEIDGTGATDTFKWSRDGGASWEKTLVPIAGAATAMLLEYGVYIEFAAITGHTSGDYWDITAAAVFTTVAEVVDISGPSFSQATHDAPSQDITWMKAVAGMVTAGEVGFDVNFIPKDATHDDSTGLLSILGNQVDWAWQLVFNDAGTGTKSKWGLMAYLVNFDHDVPVDGILKSSITLKVNGQPIFYKGTV